MNTFQVFAVLILCHKTLGLNFFSPNIVMEHNVYGYFENIGIPRAENLSLEEHIRDLKPRIVGGEAADITKYKYQAGLLISLKNLTSIGLCGGALINENRVVTAAHCWFDGVHRGKCITVILGSAELFSGGTRLETCEVHMHPKWDPRKASNDIAVVYLPNHVTFSETIAPIALPSKYEIDESFVGEVVVASGFGRISQQTPIASNQSLSEVKLTVISNEKCSLTYPEVISDSILCTSGNGTHGQVSICSGDSGGPLVLNWHKKDILVGISSFGSPLGCDENLPNGFARITSFLKFLKYHMNDKKTSF